MRYVQAGEIAIAVRNLFQINGCVVLSEVRNGTGYAKSARTADMMIFSTWPSRGIYCDGVEIKVSRSDLKHELSNPQKADDMAKYCRCWWLAVPDDLIAPDMMIPETWGILYVSGAGKASIAKKAAVLDAAPMDGLLVCSVLRNFSESYTPNAEIDARVKKAVEERLKSMKADHDYKIERFQEAFNEFKEATGVDLMSERGDPIWDIKGAGEAVKVLMAMRHRPVERLRELAQGLRDAGAIVEAALNAVDVPDKPSTAPKQ